MAPSDLDAGTILYTEILTSVEKLWWNSANHSPIFSLLPLSEAKPSKTEYRTLIHAYMDVVSHIYIFLLATIIISLDMFFIMCHEKKRQTINKTKCGDDINYCISLGTELHWKLDVFPLWGLWTVPSQKKQIRSLLFQNLFSKKLSFANRKFSPAHHRHYPK